MRPRSLLGALGLALAFAAGCGKAASTDSSQAAGEADELPEPGVTGGGPWLGSFETGLDADEQLWLLSARGEGVSIMDPSAPFRDVVSRSASGYLDWTGQISETVFDLRHERLLVTSIEQSAPVTRALDLQTGRWSPLAPSTLRNTRHGPVLLSLGAGALTLMAARDDGAFETVASVDFAPELSLNEVRVQRYLLGGTERMLVVAGGSPVRELGNFQRRESGWMPAPPLVPSGVDLAYVEVSGARACVIGVDESVWIVEGSLEAQLDVPFPVRHCAFSPDASLVAFSGQYGQYQLRITDLLGAPLADFDRLNLQANHAGFAYGTDGPNLVRLAWSTLELEVLPSPAWCRDEAGEGELVFHAVSIVGTAALVEASCPTIDSHFSGVYLLQLEDGAAPRPLLEPRAWDILQIARLADGSALISQLPYGDGDLPDGGDRFLRVSSDGTVQELGPFSDMPVPLHAPVGNVAP